jgi:multiple antibiotic resistance protein
MQIDTSSIDFFIQAVVGMIIITGAPDPAKILLFNEQLSEDTQAARKAAALRLALICLIILGGAALVGQPLLNLLGINLGAFGVAGGLVVAGMGFEMLYGGATSRAQGGPEEPEPSEGDGLLVPLAMPLIAGPGAITTMISISSADDSLSAVTAGLVAAVAVAVVVYLTFAYLGAALARVSEQTLAVLLRIGGLFLATIGIQLLLGGIGTFYGIG